MTGPELRAARKRLGMKQIELAHALGMSRNGTICAYEKGRAEIPVVVALAVRALEMESET